MNIINVFLHLESLSNYDILSLIQNIIIKNKNIFYMKKLNN